MTVVWMGLTERERILLLNALNLLDGSDQRNAAEIQALAQKMANAKPHPDISIGVYGGLVQWIIGNPFPIRICDYDGETPELPDIDEWGQRCTMWAEPADPTIYAPLAVGP